MGLLLCESFSAFKASTKPQSFTAQIEGLLTQNTKRLFHGHSWAECPSLPQIVQTL